jgi:hypothetical protein
MKMMTRSILIASSVLSILAGCSAPGGGQAAQGPNAPGWTGQTQVPGSTSTVAGDAAATDLQQKWGGARGR